ncbi:MAG TPA: PAS domain S-box protein, partial [Rhodocyclaceae bacterium]|nr:PAS domain S-box protein [Rhodocyclaceae bacterium]
MIEPRPLKGWTVRRAVVAAVLLGVLLPALVVGIYLARVFYQNTLQAEIARTLKHESEVLALGVRDSLWSLDSETAGALVDAVMSDPALVKVEVFDLQLKQFVSREVSERRQGRIYAIEQGIEHRGEIIGRVRVEITDQPLSLLLGKQLITLVGMLTLQVGSSVLLILVVLQQRLGLPLNRVSGEAARLARGELNTPIEPQRNDEIGEVESQLEITRQALQSFMRALEQKNRALQIDLRERLRVEATLRDREQRLRMLVEQSPIAVVEYDLGWHILDWNEAASRIFGWRREEVLGRHASFLLAPDETNLYTDPATPQAFGNEGLHQRNRNVRADGSTIVCQWFNNVIRDSNGVAQRIVSMAEDVTERQRSEDEIRRQATVIQLTTNLVALTDADGYIEWHNEAFVRRSGYLPQEIDGANLIQLLRGDDTESKAFDAIQHALRDGNALSGTELLCHAKNGEPYWVSAETQPVRSANGVFIQSVVLLNDITDKHRIADALKNLARIGASNEPHDFLEQLLGVLARGARANAAYLALHNSKSEYVNAIVVWSDAHWPIHQGTSVKEHGIAQRISLGSPLLITNNAYPQLREDPIVGDCDHTQALVAVAISDATGEMAGHIAILFATPLLGAEEAQSLAELGAARAGAEFARVQALDDLRHSEQKFSSIFQHSPIPLALIRRADGRYLDVNRAALEAFGFPREEFIGHSELEIGLYASQQDRETVKQLLRNDGHVDGLTVNLRSKSGELRNCQLHIRTVFMNELCLLAATVDISQLSNARRQVEELNLSLEQRVAERTRDLATTNRELETALERLQRTQDELVRSEKLAALGSLVAGVAHELNTPIGNSLMVASTLRDLNRDFRKQVDAGLKRSELDTHVHETESAADILIRNLHRAGELISSFKQVAV